MNESSILINGIQQKDNYTFSIEWSDGQVNDFRLSTLQKLCPCAGCIDEQTGKRRKDAKSLDENVRAERIVSVGRYALRVYFTSGCSTGIFGYDMLRQISKQSNERGI